MSTQKILLNHQESASLENEFTCESCGEMLERDLPESCVEKCHIAIGSKCVGKERYQKYLKGRK
ncbi:MAG: hypothetical protein HRF42_02205 [Candidatus Brocadia sp.]|jgi:hypothetical protein